MTRKVYDLSTIDKDVKRVIGKRLYKKCEDKNGGWIFAERRNGDAEYHLNSEAYNKLRKYMMEHKSSRLYKSWTGCKDGYNVRFEHHRY